MEIGLFTVHHKNGEDLRAITDRRDIFALLFPPIWMLWHRLWFSLLAMITGFVLIGLLYPPAAAPVMYGLAVILAFEGASFKRLELKLRGWREVATVQAATEEGAEELYLSGRVV